MHGIVTHYASNLHKVREKLTNIRNLVEKLKTPKIIQDAILNDVDRCTALLAKGKTDEDKVGRQHGRSDSGRTN